MKAPRLLTLVLSMSLFGTTGALASSIWGDYQGFDKVKMLINGKEQRFQEEEAPPFLIEGNAVFPVRQLSESLHALVRWNNSTQTVSVYTPNVNLLVSEHVSTDSIKMPFGRVPHGKQIDFAVFAQVDTLKTPYHSFRISIESPSGSQAVDPHVKAAGGEKESFWYSWPFTVAFKEKGDYVVKFAIQLDEGSDYTVVAEKVIVSE
ncbi:stalk domain-containing protein [Paenibacillus xerothermodurans]|uniref:Copper amine oxidase-like N-terminal domain-containing protein n=1 Tax=Paenibacillus xerothermodurans TaxID=1977292 RepID=A0A2W1NY00_PAEXE|nr:stalk domain-containing protein [Paenibacillus xerothermodurans]PZE22586.1 hypothetical protein CBW46_002065 [Paenibacillus xerothermodurans]